MIFVNENVTKKEKELLSVYYKKGPNTLVRARAESILMSLQSLPVPTIATLIMYEEQTVKEWVSSWNETRMSSIFAQYEGNENAAKNLSQ